MNPEYVVCGTFPGYIDEEGNFLYNTVLPEDDAALKKGLPLVCPFVHTSVMISADPLRKTGGYKNCGRFFYQEDLLLWIDLSKLGKFRNIPHYLVNYRISPSSSSQRSHMFQRYQMNIVETYFKTGELDYTGINSIPQEWGETDENLKMSVYHERIGAIYLTETLNIRQARAHLKKAISYHFQLPVICQIL